MTNTKTIEIAVNEDAFAAAVRGALHTDMMWRCLRDEIRDMFAGDPIHIEVEEDHGVVDLRDIHAALHGWAGEWLTSCTGENVWHDLPAIPINRCRLIDDESREWHDDLSSLVSAFSSSDGDPAAWIEADGQVSIGWISGQGRFAHVLGMGATWEELAESVLNDERITVVFEGDDEDAA